jgi:hypothetical protein
MFHGAVLAQDSSLGDGKIDNWIIDSSVHVTVGVLAVLSLTASAVWLTRLAWRGATLDHTGRWLIGITQVVLTVQILIGIKLLDQNQGFNQIYIHYIGGLVPMGAFLVGGWWVRGETPQRTRVLAVLVAIGWFSAVMAFFIGRAYVNR